jgi:uncharacterized surface anchored protein
VAQVESTNADYTVTETAAPAGYSIDTPAPQNVTVSQVGTCETGTQATVSFVDTPLSRITVSFESLAEGNPTSATIECTGDIGPTDLPEGSPRVLDNLIPGEYDCKVIVDP